jgi:hypothetical protein
MTGRRPCGDVRVEASHDREAHGDGRTSQSETNMMLPDGGRGRPLVYEGPQRGKAIG